MATAERIDVGEDHWLQIPATWGAYLRLDKARREKAKPRYTFRKGWLTIVSPGVSHELWKIRLSWCIEEIFLVVRIPFLPLGQVTLKQGKPNRLGTEADSTYYLSTIDRIRGKKTLVMGVDPAPDLVIEVVISHPVGESLKIYAAFGVREVWVCEPTGLKVLILGADGGHAVSERSALVPFLDFSQLSDWAFRQDQPDEMSLRELFRSWVVDVLVPRLRANEHGES